MKKVIIISMALLSVLLLVGCQADSDDDDDNNADDDSQIPDTSGWSSGDCEYTFSSLSQQTSAIVKTAAENCYPTLPEGYNEDIVVGLLSAFTGSYNSDQGYQVAIECDSTGDWQLPLANAESWCASPFIIPVLIVMETETPVTYSGSMHIGATEDAPGPYGIYEGSLFINQNGETREGQKGTGTVIQWKFINPSEMWTKE